MEKTELGIENLDKHINNFFARSNEFLAQIREKETVSKQKLEEIHSFFKNHLKEHFEKDEEIQAEVNYPYQQEHHRLHNILKDRINNLINSLEGREINSDFAYDVYHEIVMLLEAHINCIDRGIKKYIMN
ncbi:MAG: hemerythrin domain-containing protein [Halanaerobacter sp.]